MTYKTNRVSKKLGIVHQRLYVYTSRIVIDDYRFGFKSAEFTIRDKKQLADIIKQLSKVHDKL